MSKLKLRLQLLTINFLLILFGAGNKVYSLKWLALLLWVAINIGYRGRDNAGGKALRFPAEWLNVEELNPFAVFLCRKSLFKLSDGTAKMEG